MTTEATRARQTVAALIRSGRIVPEPCQECGATDRVEAHHPFGYEGANAIRLSWLCAPHHRAAHQETGRVEAHSTGDMALKEAAAELGVTPDNLRGAIARGTLRAKKLGRDWIVTSKEVERYRAEHRRGPSVASEG